MACVDPDQEVQIGCVCPECTVFCREERCGEVLLPWTDQPGHQCLDCCYTFCAGHLYYTVPRRMHGHSVARCGRCMLNMLSLKYSDKK